MATEKSFMRPIKNTSVVQQVINRLTDAMINKQLRPGDKIPTEAELSETFGIGRNSIREAIKVLVSFGVLEIRRPEGTFVTSGMSDKMLDPLLYGIILDDTESQESLKELREWIDVGIITFAIKNADKDDIENLKLALDNMSRALDHKDADELFKADDAFHKCLADAAHNPVFAKIGNLIRKLTSDLRQRTVRNIVKQGRRDDMRRVHTDMYNMIRKGEKVNVGQIVVDGYFYEYGILDEEL